MNICYEELAKDQWAQRNATIVHKYFGTAFRFRYWFLLVEAVNQQEPVRGLRQDLGYGGFFSVQKVEDCIKNSSVGWQYYKW